MSETETETEIRTLAENRLGGPLDAFESPLTVLASPGWRGVEAEIRLARRDEKTEIVKRYHADVAGYVDIPAAIAAARMAGKVGAGPKVLHADPDNGLLVMEHLGDGWRAGGLHDCIVPDIRANTIAAKKAIQAGPRLPRDGDICAEIDALHAACVKSGADLPANIGAYMAFVDQARGALSAAGADKVPCHRDGSTSNLMIGPGHAVRLLDYDMAANSDPFEDVGVYLTEFFERDPEAREGFEEWLGRFEEKLFQRARVYGILDDLRWTLIGLLMSATSPRRSLEFSKYASWRLMRFVDASQRSSAADRLRRIA